MPMIPRPRIALATVAAALAAALLLLVLLTLGGGCAADPSLQPALSREVRLEATALGEATAEAAVPDSLLVVTYNIQYGEDVALALSDLRRAGLDDPDVLLLQEMSPAGVDTVARALGLHAVYQPASLHPHHDREFGNAVLSRWPILDSQLLVLPHPHPWTGDRRIAVACDLDVAGRRVRTVSLHVATPVLTPGMRLEQATAVLEELVAGWTGPLIVGGDFNTSLPGDLPALRKEYRHRARLLPVPPAGCTIRWHPGRLVGARCALDHIFLRDLRAGSHGVARGAKASDHFPVWARVGWSPRR
jgi:endonuclease/exonuclease/phosphatase family metal-dependent hydrolase